MVSLNGAMFASRAVERVIVPDVVERCVQCGEPIRYVAKSLACRVIANVYEDGRWDRVEHFHAHCYFDASQPYGTAAAPPGEVEVIEERPRAGVPAASV